MTAPDWTALREEFPTLRHWTYLDSARKTIPPRCQEQAMQEYTRDVYEQAGADAWSAPNIAAARAELAHLLGADPEEIAFTKNTTEGLLIAAHAFDLRPGDNVVITNMEHVANVWIWKHWEKKGVEIRRAQHRGGRLPLEAFMERIDGRTRVVSTAYITYGNGVRVNLPQLGLACRERNIRLVVDGVQAAGVLARPLRELNADVISMGGHKGLFGLTGSGVVYCRRELVDSVLTPFVKEPEPLDAKGHATSQFDYVRVAHRFEAGNPNFLGVRVLRRGAQFVQSIGLPAIEARVRELSTHCLALLKKAGLRTMTPEPWEERAQIVNVLVPDAERVMNVLREKHRVIVNVKDDAIRISVGFFNNEEDLEKAVSAIARETSAKGAVAA
jgi:selenocysteine lyase/cysteine desulfurase